MAVMGPSYDKEQVNEAHDRIIELLQGQFGVERPIPRDYDHKFFSNKKWVEDWETGEKKLKDVLHWLFGTDACDKF